MVQANMCALTTMPADYAEDPDLDYNLIRKIPNESRWEMEQILWLPVPDDMKNITWHCRLCNVEGEQPKRGWHINQTVMGLFLF